MNPDEWAKHLEEKTQRWLKLSDQERLNLAHALIGRQNRRDEGLERLRKFFPAAPEDMLRTAAWHLYSEAPRAAVDFLAEVELTLREDDPHFHGPAGVDLLYHFYNFLQFRALLPRGPAGLRELVEDIQECLEDGDTKRATKQLEALKEKLEACESPPDFD